ncbi:MAG: hypothetical protein QXT53_03500 [Ignisphaera sp.]
MLKTKHIFLLVIALIALSTLYVNQGSSQSGLYINWFVYENPSPTDERPFSVCTLGKYIYVVGYDATKINYGYRVEKRLKDNGALVKVWQYNPTVRDDVLFDCLALNNTIYVIGIEGALVFPSATDFGKIVVIALDQDLNILKYFKMNITGFATSITTDGIYIYVGGFYQKNIDRGWFIAKLTQNLDLVKLVLYKPSLSDDYIYQIKFDRASNMLWIVGLEGGMYASVAYVDANLSFREPVKVLNNEILGSALSIDFDEYGNKYISVYGSMGNKFIGLIKLDKNNNIVATVNRYYGQKVMWAWGALYVIQTDSKVSITVLDSNLNQVYSYTINESTYCNQYLMLGNVAFDENNLYFAASLCQSGDSGWGIYSSRLLIQIRYNTVTQRLTLTTTRILENTVTTVNSYTITVVKTIPPETITFIQSSTISSLATTTMTMQMNFTITQNSGFETKTVILTTTSSVTSIVREVVYQTFTETLPSSTATVTITQWCTYTKTVSPKSQNNLESVLAVTSTVAVILGVFIVATLRKRN